MKLIRRVVAQPAIALYPASTEDPFDETGEVMLRCARMAGSTPHHVVGARS